MTQQCKEYVNNNYIIGTLPFNNIFIKSYYCLNDLLRSPSPKLLSYYICTCGQYYTLDKCTCPSIIYNCSNSNCKLKIGEIDHKLLGRKKGQTDHFRVFFEEKDKKINKYMKME